MPARGSGKPVAMPGSQMAAEMAEQPAVLGGLLERAGEIAARVRALADPAPVGVILIARGSSDNAAIYGRYLLEPVVRRPVALAAPSLSTLYGAEVDCTGWLAIALSQSGETPEIVDVFARMRAAGARGIAAAELPIPTGIPEALAPIVAVARAQQLSAEVALARGLDPDAPPGLTKVTPTR
jgi:fructoselysine-6-P-deglycase FrlB-like protein